MNVPAHYRKFYHCYIKFSITMMIVALLMGIMFQESAKKAPISAALPAGAHLEAVINLALVHGHVFLIGALIPLALTWMLHLAFTLGHQPVSEKSLKIGSMLYLPGSVLAVILMLYKGYHYIIGVRLGQTNLEALNDSFFFGSHVLRAIAYGTTHTAMAIGLAIIVIGIWKSLKTEAAK
jgi:hypothetical protein